MFSALISISMISFFIEAFYLILYLERFKKKIVKSIFKKAGRNILEQIILENKRRSGMAEKELQFLEAELKKFDSSRIEKEIINKILTKLDSKTVAKKISWASMGSLPTIMFWKWGETKSINFIEELGLERIIENKVFLEELRLLDKDREKKERFCEIVLLVTLVIFSVSAVVESYGLIKSIPEDLSSPNF